MPTAEQVRAGRVLGVLIERARVTTKEVAEAIGTSRQHVYNKLRGEAWTPRDTATFTAAFGVQEEIFELEEIDAMLWLIQNDHFNLSLRPLAGPRSTIDLRAIDQAACAPGESNPKPADCGSVGLRRPSLVG